MTDKKLTDKEIVKALGQCETQKTCYDCPYFEKIGCKKHLYQNALDLINRLQADCENYKQIAEHQQSVTLDRGFEIKRLKEKIESLQAENERLEKENKQLKNAYQQCAYEREMFLSELNDAKVEAHKEFAYNLKQIPRMSVYKNEIDNLLKDLVGEDDA